MTVISTNSRGFTLIEIMVAMAIMALIGVGAISVLNTATQTTDKIKINGDRLNDIQRAFMIMSNDMQQLTKRLVRDEYGDKLPSMKSDLQASAPYIRFTRLGRRNPAQLARSNLEHLLYVVEDKTLYRISYTYVDGMVEDQGLKRPMLENVEDMKVTFYDGEEWHDYWPINEAVENEQLSEQPIAVKMELELTDYGKLERLYAILDKSSARSEDSERR